MLRFLSALFRSLLFFYTTFFTDLINHVEWFTINVMLFLNLKLYD
ncbi:hypothetical protein HMPREF9104_02265 [Lentilactobacillus kisonensis F0435]|uniref:Uncharacterized protein n=1 Tax=Lentilactobacillus kisonensis F0435 TaxID=797516 RepID=H1LI24_9LACO|nr:hypothetical protein HMPREF9104_02265 [Lentilactobacillus kisonensis F0435]